MGVGIIIFIIVFLLFISLTASNLNKYEKEKKDLDNRIVVEKKECPPHQWFYQEVVDQHGNPQGGRIVCKICGPIKGSSDE